MSKENKPLSHCPSRSDLELYSLETGLSRAEKQRVGRHLAQCASCRRSFRALDRFYEFLVAEMKKPLTNTALEMTKSYAPKSVRYGLLICRPIPEKNRRLAKAYHTQLVFSANGEPGRRKLCDFNLDKLPADCLAVRLFTDPVFNEMSLYLWQHGADRQGSCKLRWSDTRQALHFSPIGSSKMALADFKSLDGRLFYLSNSVRKKSKTTRFEMICPQTTTS
jgi:hypothetical protein